jgi:hypothetical protein
MASRSTIQISKCGLVFLSLTLAAAARAQPTPPQVEPSARRDPPAPGSHQAPDEEPQRNPGARTHDGVYLRLQLGVGYTNMSANKTGTETIAGDGVSFGIALGDALNSNLIIYGTLVDGVAFNPTTKMSGTLTGGPGMVASLASGGGLRIAGVTGVGGGAAYYLDSNLFLAGSLLGSRLSVSDVVGTTMKSDWGVTLEGLFGKEWWVSDNWGLGVAGQLWLGVMSDSTLADASTPTWRLAALSVLLSASYN